MTFLGTGTELGQFDAYVMCFGLVCCLFCLIHWASKK